MYRTFYGLKDRPFSITPDPRYVYLSRQHQDALAHLLYGVGRGGSGGFVQLTGEVGTGKTTLCRLLLEQVPEKTRIALILNPMLAPRELLEAICDELEIATDDTNHSVQQLNRKLNRFLLDCHAAGERVVLLIDEAQNMSREALEQVRLLTNLETATDKLLQIILLGQPELRALLDRPELRQLAQRITARYHLAPLTHEETAAYVRHRLAVAGAPRCPFTRAALGRLYAVSRGIPRLINIIADRALMAGFARERERIGPALVNAAAREVVGGRYERSSGWLRGATAAAALSLVVVGGAVLAWLLADTTVAEPPSEPDWVMVLENPSAEHAFAEAALFWRRATVDRLRRACDEGVSDGFACISERGNWALIQRLNRPVILRLAEPDGGHLLLTGVHEDALTVQYDGRGVRLPRAQADRRWLGEFLVIWPDGGEIFRLDDESEGVAYMKRLAQAYREHPYRGEQGSRFGEDFREWVVAFQRHHGLADDGMIGPSTRLYLEVPQLDGPRLVPAEDN